MGDNRNKRSDADQFLGKELHLMMFSPEQKQFQTQTARFLLIFFCSSKISYK
jgi:hypothetical protein